MPGVAPAAHQAHEPRLLGQDQLQVPGEIGRVVVGVDGEQLGPGGDALGVGGHAKAELGRPAAELLGHGRGSQHDQYGCRRVRLQVGLDAAQLMAEGPQCRRAGGQDRRRRVPGGGVELGAAECSCDQAATVHQHLGPRSRGRLAVGANNGRQQDFLAAAEPPGELFFDPAFRHARRPCRGPA